MPPCGQNPVLHLKDNHLSSPVEYSQFTNFTWHCNTVQSVTILRPFLCFQQQVLQACTVFVETNLQYHLIEWSTWISLIPPHFYPWCYDGLKDFEDLFIIKLWESFDLAYGLAFYSKVVHTSFLYLKSYGTLQIVEEQDGSKFIVVMFNSYISLRNSALGAEIGRFLFLSLWINTF